MDIKTAEKPVIKVLVVDDEEHWRLLIQCCFKDDGRFAVDAVSSGVEAIESIAANPPDLLLLDLHLGDISGFDVLRALGAGAHTRSIAVIAMTGATDEDELLQSAATCLKAKKLLYKPFDMVEMINLAGELVHLEPTAPAASLDASWRLAKSPDSL